MTVKLTKKVIDQLPRSTNPSGTRYFDSLVTGFQVAVYPSGKKTFHFSYYVGKLKRFIAIGEYGSITPEDARKEAERLRADVNMGKNPANEKRERRQQQQDEILRRYKFKDWAETYLAEVKEYRKSYKDFKHHLGRAIATFGKENLADITPRMVEAEFKRITRHRSEIVANRWAATLQGCFRVAKKRGLIEINPVVGLERNQEHPGRTRALSDAEYVALTKAIREHPNPYERAAFLLLTETGARLGEVLHAKWEDFDFESLRWTMPDTKAGKTQTIPIVQKLADELQLLPRIGLYVVLGKDPLKPRFDLKNAWAAVLAASGIKKANLHDLRRTFCVQVARKSGLYMASRLLRHADIRTTARHYAPVEIEQMRDALEDREAQLDPVKKKAEGK